MCPPGPTPFDSLVLSLSKDELAQDRRGSAPTTAEDYAMVDRRQFLLSAAALAASAKTGFAGDDVNPGGVFPPSVRADFPIASAETYMNSASIHPLSVHAAKALSAAHRVPGAAAPARDARISARREQEDLKSGSAR